MKKILVLGSNGSLGNRIFFALKKNKYKVFNQTRKKKNKYFCDFKNEKRFYLLVLEIILPSFFQKKISITR